MRNHKLSIGLTITDVQGISTANSMHKISLAEGYKLSVEPWRRLNPIMKEVLKKELLLDVRIIYPILDNSWVSPIQYVPKKSVLTVVTNQMS